MFSFRIFFVITAATIFGGVEDAVGQEPISFAEVVQGDEKSRVYTSDLTYFGETEGIVRIARWYGMDRFSAVVQYFEKVDENKYLLKQDLATLDKSVYDSYNLKMQQLSNGTTIIQVSYQESGTRDPKGIKIWVSNGEFSDKPPTSSKM